MPSSDSSSSATLLLHIGARDDSLSLAGPVSARVRHVLVQPDPDQALALRAAASPASEVLELGLAPGGEHAELLQMNFAALNSFHEPTAALYRIFPGLKVVRRQSVPVLSAAALLKRIAAPDQVIDLVLEAAGSELRLLQDWKAAGGLKQVRNLVVRCGSEVFFDGATDRAGVDAFLSAEGFVRQAEDLIDPDWPVVHWQADPALQRLKAALAEAQALLEAKTRALTAAEERLRIAEETAKATETRFAEMKAASDKEKAAAEQNWKLADQEIRQARADTGLRLRLESMHRIDIENLQNQLRSSEEQRQSLEALLRKLTPRLEQAARELRDLHAGEIAAPAMRPELSAPSGPQDRPIKKARKQKAVSK